MYPTRPRHDRTATHTVPPTRRTTAGLLVSLTPLAAVTLALALATVPLTPVAGLVLSALLAVGALVLTLAAAGARAGSTAVPS